jgi:hypothetical protein
VDARVIWEPPERFGVTIPLLYDLMHDYAERRRRELHEDAVVGAIAARGDANDIASLREESDEPEDDSEMEFEPAPWR